LTDATLPAALIRLLPDVISIVDASGLLTYTSPGSYPMLGYLPEELVGTSAFDLIHPVDQVSAAEGFTSTLASSDSRPVPLLMRLRHARGHWIDAEIIGVNHLDDPEIAGMVVTIRDVSESMRTDGALRLSEERYRLIVELGREGICMVDDGENTTFANRALADLLDTTVNELLGSSLLDFIDVDDRAEARIRIAGPNDDARTEQDLRIVTRQGRLVWARIRASAIRHHDGTYRGAIVFVTDVTERRNLEQRLAEEARRDPLTGVANRKELFEVLSPILQNGSLTAALYVDLDGFKEVNDRFGHTLGDELLCTVAGRLRGAIRVIDTLARVGGDEFVVICRDLESTDEAVAIGERIREVLAHPFGLAVGPVSVDASIGIAFGRGSDADDLLARADQALYRAKRKGRGRIEITFDNAAA
jgi:diguanylate cyclase (GGDEF)-like protein/PAS domain S-box-containing protein